jgi:hypothetical protein
MRTPEERDVTTLVIARTIAIFVVVLGAGVLLLVVAAQLGADALETGVVVVAALAALLSLVFVVRHRHD